MRKSTEEYVAAHSERLGIHVDASHRLRLIERCRSNRNRGSKSTERSPSSSRPLRRTRGFRGLPGNEESRRSLARLEAGLARTVPGILKRSRVAGKKLSFFYKVVDLREWANLVRPLSTIYDFLEEGQLLSGDAGPLQDAWDRSSESSFGAS